MTLTAKMAQRKKDFVVLPFEGVAFLGILFLGISWFLFMVTTGGWAGLFVYLIATPIHILVGLPLALCWLIYSEKRRYAKIKLSRKEVKLLFVALFIAVILNEGDCGDGGGGTYLGIENIVLNSMGDNPCNTRDFFPYIELGFFTKPFAVILISLKYGCTLIYFYLLFKIIQNTIYQSLKK